MKLYLIIPILLSAFIIIGILICNFKTFKIERYMRSRIKTSTVLDIFTMSFYEKKVGGVCYADSRVNRGSKKSEVVIDSGYIKFLRTNQKEQEWEEICERNIQQAINLGFSKRLVTNSIIYEYKTNSGDFLNFHRNGDKFDLHGNDINVNNHNISISCKNDEILLEKKPGWKNISDDYDSIKTLIDNFKKFEQSSIK